MDLVIIMCNVNVLLSLVIYLKTNVPFCYLYYYYYTVLTCIINKLNNAN